MTSGRFGVLAAVIVATLGIAGRGRAQDAPSQAGAAPYKTASQEPLEFRGPGRELPEPRVSEVILGWFGPDDPDHPEFGELWRGAALAVEQENRAGGYRPMATRASGVGSEPPSTTEAEHARGTIPFRLVAAWSENPWQAGVRSVARLVEERGAWAVVGGVDGTTTHLAVQLALKLHFLLLSPGSSDVTADLANVPWLFSLAPSDERIAPLLADAVARAAGRGPFALAAATDHDSHAALVAVRRALAARRLGPAALVEMTPLEDDPAQIARRLLVSRPRAVVVLAGSSAAGRLVVALRQAGFTGPIVGGAPLARTAFRRVAGEAAEGVVVPLSAGAGPAREAFARLYAERWGEPPDDAATQAYDAVRLTVAAVRRAGLNRARIRDAARALAPWPGAEGEVRWDARGRNLASSRLGVWRRSRPLPAERE